MPTYKSKRTLTPGEIGMGSALAVITIYTVVRNMLRKQELSSKKASAGADKVTRAVKGALDQQKSLAAAQKSLNASSELVIKNMETEIDSLHSQIKILEKTLQGQKSLTETQLRHAKKMQDSYKGMVRVFAEMRPPEQQDNYTKTMNEKKQQEVLDTKGVWFLRLLRQIQGPTPGRNYLQYMTLNLNLGNYFKSLTLIQNNNFFVNYNKYQCHLIANLKPTAPKPCATSACSPEPPEQ